MGTPLKILHVTYSLKISGIETLATNIHKYVDKEKVNFDFAVYCNPNIEEHYDSEVIKNGGIIHKLSDVNNNKSVINILKERIRFFKLLKEQKYDVIHIHGSSGMHIIEAAISKFLGCPNVIIHSHSSKLINNNKYYYCKKILHYSLKWMWPLIADHYFACSNEAAEWLFPKKINNSGKVEMIKNGIDSQKYIFNFSKRDEIRSELSLKDKFVIGHIGRFSKIKNQSFLIDVFYDIYKKRKDAVLVLIGQGELEEEVKFKVKELGIDEVVLFLGVRKDIADLLQAMDIFMLTSLFEGLPIAGIEAQAAGLPLVISNTVTKELDLTGNVSYLSLNEDISVWSETVINTFNNYNRYDTSYKIKENGFDIQEIAKDLENYYINLIGESNESV